MPVLTPKLIHAQATKVLGEYDHALPFDEDSEFTIIYGPNGVGKTKFLEIINAVSRLDGRSLQTFPFASATLKYSDGHSITVKSLDRKKARNREPVRPRVNIITFSLEFYGTAVKSWEFSDDNFERWLIENTTWRQVGPDMWEDRVDRELADLADLEMRFEHIASNSEEVPEELKYFAAQVPSYLIETQRLRIEQYMDPHTTQWRIRSRRNRENSSSKIAEHASKMRILVNEAQTEHSRITQQLDRTFPNRILTASQNKTIDADHIRKRYNDQNGFRSRLGRVVSVTLAEALSLPERELNDFEIRLLNLYLDDADQKLAPFEMLLRKVELLEAIVNSRLLNKRLQVTASDGLTVIHPSDNRHIELDSLSSGEQHEIILMFDLLFNVPEGALVLVDEPEISLHVVWQLAFIPDVQRVAKLAGFRFIVATHSPQIINDSWHKAVRLGPSEAEFQ
jgi:predicted ATP-binding protein involved in virulence